MASKLRDYQVIDVFFDGALYKVRHKTTNDIFTWKAYSCTDYTPEELDKIIVDVKTVLELKDSSFLRFYDTILHLPSKTLYFVREYNSWKSLVEVLTICKESNRFISENYVWQLLHELSRLCKMVQELKLDMLKIKLSQENIYINENGAIKVNFFDLNESAGPWNMFKDIGEVISSICNASYENKRETISGFIYSEDLIDVMSFLLNEKNSHLKADVLMRHPTVLANLETNETFESLDHILINRQNTEVSTNNQCENALQLCRTIPVDDESIDDISNPIYVNISPRYTIQSGSPEQKVLSPTLAALALELPGYIPKQKPVKDQSIVKYKEPQIVSENTLSNQWLSRLIALREREESLNRRERDLISKEIVNSPRLQKSLEPIVNDFDDNIGITLPPLLRDPIDVPDMNCEEKQVVAKRNSRRSSSVRTRSRRRRSCNYVDMDSSLSADTGDNSIVVTTTKFSKENLPRRNIFPANKKVHFTSVNPFVESDESVTLTFYELDDKKHISPDIMDDVNKFKYLDLEKLTNDKRSAVFWNETSPNKQAKMTSKALNDITNIKKAPSKASLTSKTSTVSQYSTASSQKSIGSDKSTQSYQSCLPRSQFGGSVRSTTSGRQSLAPNLDKIESKKSKGRLSLLPFKTPFKFSRRVD